MKTIIENLKSTARLHEDNIRAKKRDLEVIRKSRDEKNAAVESYRQSFAGFSVGSMPSEFVFAIAGLADVDRNIFVVERALKQAETEFAEYTKAIEVLEVASAAK